MAAIDTFLRLIGALKSGTARLSSRQKDGIPDSLLADPPRLGSGCGVEVSRWSSAV